VVAPSEMQESSAAHSIGPKGMGDKKKSRKDAVGRAGFQGLAIRISASDQQSSAVESRHEEVWIPAFAGMTESVSASICGVKRSRSHTKPQSHKGGRT